MSHNYYSEINLHLTWHTKDSLPLLTPQVQALATKLGLNVTKAEAAIATISGAELQTLATQARATNAPLAGGDTVIISVTTLLLILIIVLLVAR